VALVVALVLIALVVGGLTQVGRQSHSYDVGTNRALAAQGETAANESNASAGTLRHLLSDMPRLSRPALQSQLDELVQQTTAQSAQAALAADPAPSASLAGRFAMVFAQRAQAVGQVRAAIDGLLGMHPLPVAGAAGGNQASTATPTLLSATQATNRMAAAGTLLASADQTYRAVRRALAHGTGEAALPASVWVPNAQTWELGAVAERVDLLTASTSLAATHHLVLQAVRLSPPALPTAAGTASGTSVLSPTSTVAVSVVVSNMGSVDEPHVTVQFALAVVGSTALVTRTRHASVASGASVAFTTVVFTVKPGRSYQLAVAVNVPPGQASTTGTGEAQVLQIAPGT
jgi:hypothetical protein